MLTRDADIVDVRFIVQYRIRSATDYLFRSVDPERSVSQAAQAAVRAIVGTQPADVLNRPRRVARAAFRRDPARSRSLPVARGDGRHDADVAAPEQTQAAYGEVAKARDEREAAKRAAQAYANDLLPKAQGDAAKLVDEAKAYADRVVTEAEGDADRFKQVYAQYSKAPAVIRERMYLETMQEIYSNSTKVFVGNKGGNSVVYLPLDKLVEQGRQTPRRPRAHPHPTRRRHRRLPHRLQRRPRVRRRPWRRRHRRAAIARGVSQPVARRRSEVTGAQNMNRIIALVVAIVIVAFAASSTVLTVDPRHAAVLSGRDGAQPELAGWHPFQIAAAAADGHADRHAPAIARVVGSAATGNGRQARPARRLRGEVPDQRSDEVFTTTGGDRRQPAIVSPAR